MPCLISPPLRQPLVVPLLPLLELLSLLILPRAYLFLLSLVFLVHLRPSCVWRNGACRRKVVRMNRGVGTWSAVVGACRSSCTRSRRFVRRRRRFGSYYATPPEFRRLRRGCDWRPAVIHRLV